MALSLGIDLGTTNSVAAVHRGAKTVFVADQHGRRIHPSVVSFTGRGVLVGATARDNRAIDPANTIYSAKRLIGQNIRSPLVQLALPHLPYRVDEGPNQQPIITAQERRLTVPEISSHVLSYLRQLAEHQFGETIQDAVITVPANFSDAQRRATKEAGRIAGLKVMRLVNEPTAAALAYGYGQNLNDTIAVFDFGGGTFDVSILRVRNEIFEVLASDGDFFLGGDDLDLAVCEHLAALMTSSTGINPRPMPDAISRLLLAAEQIKCHLSGHSESAGTISGIGLSNGEVVSLPFRITREKFESLISGYVERTLEMCRGTLAAARLEPKDIGSVICVGGTTRIPYVRKRLAELFGRLPIITVDPDLVVAQGAAVQAATLAGAVEAAAHAFATAEATQPAHDGGLLDLEAEHGATQGGVPVAVSAPGSDPIELLPQLGLSTPRALLLDVTPAALGIATTGGYAEKLIDKNAPIPIERTRVFLTTADNQEQVKIDCCRGSSRRFDENEAMGALVLEGLSPRPRGETQIEVTFRVDTDGIVHVRAMDRETRKSCEASLNVLGAPVDAEDS